LAPEASTWDASRIIRYPEWDERIETFRENWCTLLDKSASEADSATAQVHVGRSRSWTGGRARELDRAIRLRRQRQGERFDFDALIDAMASRRQGGHIDERVFECPGTRAREAAILMLLDVSASSAQPLAGQAVTVLETEKALALRAVALAQQGAHRIAVHGFASNTRNEVRYERYVDFGVALGPAQRQRLANATAGWSTRFGAALRHACALVGAQPVRDRIILMVTDGAPADIDVTRDAYLVEDARMAVQQARRAGIRCFCLALDAQADAYVRRIFGVRNYLISVDADFLQQRLKSVLATLVQP
jgi:nitric oxide reductase activation protein